MASIGATSLFDVRGISMSTYSEAGYSDSSIVNMIDRAVAGGTNQIILGNIVLADLKTGALTDVIESAHNQTADFASIERAIRAAKDAGLEIVLKPQVAVHDPEYDQYNSASWINMVNPNLVIEKPEIFFSNYKAELIEWAKMAQRTGAEALCIGNEMVAATKPEFLKYWEDIITSVREVFAGELTYAALAPVMTNASVNEITQVGFWDKLDYAGFDVYPSLYHGRTPTVADLVDGWRDATVYGHQQDYYTFLGQMAEHVKKPVVFMETGLPSFDGASDREATSDGFIGTGQRAADQEEQADWWQAFFEVWNVDPPTWLKGIFVVNNDPGQLGSYYDQNYNINGKIAEKVISSWFGGQTSLAADSDTLVGSKADDRLFLYDATVKAEGLGLMAHQKTTVSVVVTAGIIDGKVPTLSASINGHSFEKMILQPYDSGYVAGDGVHWTTNATFTFELGGIVDIQSLRVNFDSEPLIGTRRSTTFFHSVAVNGVALSDAAYYPLGSNVPFAGKLPVHGVGGTASQWNGGYTMFDTSPWNSAVKAFATGSAGDPIKVDGQEGTDVVHVLGTSANYYIERHANGAVSLSDVGSLNQAAVLSRVETVAFSDGTSLNLSLLPSAGKFYAKDLVAAQAEVRADFYPLFDDEAYLGYYADVGRAGYDALSHFRDFGAAEGRNPSARFDTGLYLLHNPDIGGTHLNALDHYLTIGRLEGRAAYAVVGATIAPNGFDAEFYLLDNPDVARAGIDAATHYNTYGRFEGRDPNAFFDTDKYLLANPDVARSGMDPLTHYAEFGWKEGRDPSGAFDTRAYLAAYTDVAESGINPLVHFLDYGAFELRNAQADGVLTGTQNIIG